MNWWFVVCFYQMGDQTNKALQDLAAASCQDVQEPLPNLPLATLAIFRSPIAAPSTALGPSLLTLYLGTNSSGSPIRLPSY
jgi:hypothetical protein